MLRSVARSESNKLPVFKTKRSGSMEGPFGSTYSVNMNSSPINSSATMPSVTRIANCNYEAIDGRLGPLPPPPVPSINGRPSPPSSRSVTQPLVNSQANGTRRSPSLTNHPALGVSSLFSSSNHAAIQNNITSQNRLSPGRITHLQLLTGEKKNEAVNAFTSSSSSSASASSGSNPPSVPTTPESQSNERLSTLTRSQPDLSKLDELEYYLTKININNSNSNNSNGSNYNLYAPSGNNPNGNLNNNHHNNIINSSNNINNSNSNSSNNNNNGNNSNSNYSVYVNTSNGAIGYTGCPIRFESQRCSGIDTDSLYSNAAVINQYSNSNNYSVNKLPSSSSTSNTSLPYGGRITNSTCNLPPPSPPKSQVNKNSEYQNQAHIQELLRMENRALKSEIEILKSKLAKYEKVEEEIQRVYQVHEEFVNSTEKKERLEKVLRYKLNMEVKKLQEENKQLKEQNEAALSALASSSSNGVNLVIDSAGTVSPCYSADSGGTGNSSNAARDKGRELLIAQLLVTENKELRADKETQEYELQAQRLTLAEQRMHIEILDNALLAAQSNVAGLEAELRKLQAMHKPKESTESTSDS